MHIPSLRARAPLKKRRINLISPFAGAPTIIQEHAVTGSGRKADRETTITAPRNGARGTATNWRSTPGDEHFRRILGPRWTDHVPVARCRFRDASYARQYRTSRTDEDFEIRIQSATAPIWWAEKDGKSYQSQHTIVTHDTSITEHEWKKFSRTLRISGHERFANDS